MAPAPFSDIGKRVKDLLTKDYISDQKFTLLMLSETGMGVTATGVTKGQIFHGDISTQYKSGNAIVDVKVDTGSTVSTTVTLREVFPSTKAALSFKIPDHKSGKLDVHYVHPHAAITSSIGLTPTPFLEFSTAIGSKDVSLGGEIAFDTATSSLTKYNAGIGLNKPDFAASLLLVNKGETLKVSYIHSVNPISGAIVGAELTHRFSTSEKNFTIGSSYSLDPYTLVKARYSDTGKVAMLCQREWRPKSLITFSAEYESKVVNASPKLGLALSLKP